MNQVLAFDRPHGCNFHFFRESIKPSWEDPANEHGGKWQIELEPFASREAVDQLWLKTLAGMIGETFSEDMSVCGCVLAYRKNGIRLALWIACKDETGAKRAGTNWKSGVAISTPVQFFDHEASAARSKDASFTL